MKPAIKNALGLIGCLCGVALIPALVFLSLLFHSVDRAAQQVEAAGEKINVALAGKKSNHHDGILWIFQEFLKNADGAANQIKQTAGDANKIAKQQEPKMKALADASITLVKSSNDTVAKLGKAATTLDEALVVVKDQTIPKVTDSATDTLAAYAALPRAFQPTIEAVNKTSPVLLRRVGDTISQTRITMLEAAQTMKTVRDAAPKLADSAVKVGQSADGIAADVHSITSDIAKPKSLWAKVRSWLETAGKIGARFL
jgi:hypothetical protein